MMRQSVYFWLLLLTISFTYSEGERSIDSSHKGRFKRAAEVLTEGAFQPYPDSDVINLCDNATVDAMITLANGYTYVFRGHYYWRAEKNKLLDGYPKLIEKEWPGLLPYIDAALAYGKDQIYFFRGSKYWKFTNYKMNAGYPKNIEEGFPGIPEGIDAATTWGKNGYIYFFKGSYYWRYEPKCEHPVRNIYPKLIRDVWRGIPDDIDEAVLFTNGILYFMKGMEYWRFNDAKLKVDEGYPLLSAPEWFGCFPEP